jgi:hypothetical protein
VPSQFTVDFVAEGKQFEAQQAARKATGRSSSSAKEGTTSTPKNAPSESPLFKRQGSIEQLSDETMGDSQDNVSAMVMSHEETIRIFQAVDSFSSAMPATTNMTTSTAPVLAPSPVASDDSTFSVSNPQLNRERTRPPPASSVPSQFTIDFVDMGKQFEAQQAARKTKVKGRSSKSGQATT